MSEIEHYFSKLLSEKNLSKLLIKSNKNTPTKIRMPLILINKTPQVLLIDRFVNRVGVIR